jgi:hypothetical protein
MSKKKPTSLLSLPLDFWFLGGASIVMWILLVSFEPLRQGYPSINQRYLEIGATFSILSLVCNYPHFMASYRLAYGRGGKFVRSSPISLIFVPLALVGLFAWTYSHWSTPALSRLPYLNRGNEFLSLSVWLMYLTVGWHYSKQVFGCLMVYSKYDAYPLSALQRNLLKGSVFSVAFFNFFSFSAAIHTPYLFFNIPLFAPGFPSALEALSGAAVIALGLAVLTLVFGKNWIEHRKLPSLCFLAPWVAFHLWWIPPIRQLEYYASLIPFFHSLQYLPFAYRVEESRQRQGKNPDLWISLVVLATLAAGFLAFEGIPTLLDHWLETPWKMQTVFFTVSAAVFINIHHFFIDSTLWRFKDPVVQRSLFDARLET